MKLVTNSLVEKSLTDVRFFVDSLKISVSFEPGSISFNVPTTILETEKIPTKKNKNKLTTVYENEAEAFPSTM